MDIIDQINMGNWDRVTRILLALGIGYLYYINAITGILFIILIAIALILFITGIVGNCPLYSLFSIRTTRR